MRFWGALLRILKQVLTADPRLGPVHLSKVDLADVYMRLWVRVGDVLSVTSLITNKTPSDTQLVGLHLSLPMVYINSAPYFCMEMETMANLANKAISQKYHAGKHPFELASESIAADDDGAPEAQVDANWENFPAKQHAAAKANVDVYLDNLTSVVQGVPRERRQILRHLFHQIDWVFRPN